MSPVSMSEKAHWYAHVNHCVVPHVVHIRDHMGSSSLSLFEVGPECSSIRLRLVLHLSQTGLALLLQTVRLPLSLWTECEGP